MGQSAEHSASSQQPPPPRHFVPLGPSQGPAWPVPPGPSPVSRAPSFLIIPFETVMRSVLRQLDAAEVRLALHGREPVREALQ